MIVVPLKVIGKVLAGEVTLIRKPTSGWVKGESHVMRSKARGSDLTRLRILSDPAPQLLHEVTDVEAQEEGWPDREVLFAYWREAYGEGPLSGDVTTYRYEVELNAEEIPRFPSRRVIPGKQGDYVNTPVNAADDQAPSDEYLQTFGMVAAQMNLAKKAKVPLEQRLAQARMEARQKGVDVVKIEAAMERHLARMERKLRGKAA